MKWIHAAYLPDAGFRLWGEAAPESDAEMHHDGQWSFALSHSKLSDLLNNAFHLSAGTNDWLTAYFPTSGNRAVPSTPLIGEMPTVHATTQLCSWKLPAVTVEQSPLLELLSNLEESRVEPGIFCAPDLLYWAAMLRFGLHLAFTQKYIPGVTPEAAIWRPILLQDDKTYFQQMIRMMPPVCRSYTIGLEKPPVFSASSLARSFLNYVLGSVIREAALPVPASRNTAHDQWLAALASPQTTLDRQAAVSLESSVLQWSAPLLRRASFDYRLAFRLEEPTRKRDSWNVRYFLQKEAEPPLLVPLERLWKGSKTAVLLFADQMQLAVENTLASLAQAAKIDSSIEMSLSQSQPGGYKTDTQGAWEFLNSKAWLLQDAGFGILLPSWWGRKQTAMRLGLKAKARGSRKSFAGGGASLTVDFDWKLAIGQQEISYQEFMALARLKVPLIKFRGKWVELRPEQIEAAKQFWNSQALEHGNISDLLKLITGATQIGGELPVTDVQATGWLSEFMHQFESHASYRLVAVPETFHGTLRDYQHRGFSWLHFLKTFGLGACLADDMGLGKTIQSIALLLSGDASPVLLICPTSVVGNWQRELERFAPSLRVMIHHGLKRKKGSEFAQEIRQCDVVISSYSLLLRDIATLGDMRWQGIILDEAQNIKNAETKQARAARSLQAGFRIALTGTPVENHVGELWSIFEFLNPGLLGTRADFKERYFNPIQSMNDSGAAEQLKRITGPFLLRRLKTDPEIVKELPGKMEMKVFCNLTMEQASLYAAAVRAMEKDLDNSEGIERKGKILASLMKLKQICNHPAHFLKDASPLEGRSGKLSRLVEMVEEVLALQERALIFTQFVEMGGMLKPYLENYFGKEVAFLHGGVPRSKREKLVERFNDDPEGPPLFLLSLKAGGTGLNLTRANHVFHFDRWWNPAVEDQATDRAYRIGQKKNVQVHKMVCVGTVEERIDAMIESKKSIARDVVGTGEGWLSELSTSEIKALVALGSEAVSV